MKKLLVIALLTLTLGGCATQFGQRLENAYQAVTSAAVTPTQIIVAGNAFDAAEIGATNYLVFCKTNKAVSICALATRKKVVFAVREGRKARDTLEPYAVAGKAGPSVIYNTLITAISDIRANVPANGATQ